MTAAEQFRKVGACVEADETGLVIIQTERTFTAMTIEELVLFDRFLHESAHQAARHLRAFQARRTPVSA